MTVNADTGLELHSLITPDAKLEVSLVEVPIPVPQPNEVLIRIEAAPINPSDLGLLLANTDMSGATVTGTAESPVVTLDLSPGAMRALAGRVGASLSVGNEGAGTVIDAGPSKDAQTLIGRSRCPVARCMRSIAASTRPSAWCWRRAPRRAQVRRPS